MAQNNALQFTISFIRDDQSLENIIKEVTNRLKNLQVTLDIKGVNITGATEQFKNLETTIQKTKENLSSMGDGKALGSIEKDAKAADDSITRLVDQLSNLLQKLNSNDFKGFAQNLEKATQAAEALVQELSRLDTKFARKFGEGFGKGMAKELDRQQKAAEKAGQAQDEANRKTEQSAAHAEAKTKALVASLNALGQAAKLTGSASSKMGEAFEFRHLKGFAVAKEEIEQIGRLLRDVESRLLASKQLGFDTGLLKQQKEDLLFMKGIFDQISSHPHPGYLNINGALYSGLQVKDAMATNATKVAARNEIDAVDKASAAYARLEEMKAKLQSVPQGAFGLDGLGDRIKTVTAQIEKLMSEIKSAPDQMSKSTYVNQAFKSLEKEANDIIRLQAKIEQDAARGATEEENAQKKLQSTLAKTKEEFNKLYDASTKTRTLGMLAPQRDITGPLDNAQAKLTELLNLRRQIEQALSGNATPKALISLASSEQVANWRNGLTEVGKALKDAQKSLLESTKADSLLTNVINKMQELSALSQKAGGLGLSGTEAELNNTIHLLEQVHSELVAIIQTGKSSKGLGLGDWLKTGELSNAFGVFSQERRKAKNDIAAEERNTIRRNRTEATEEIARLKTLMKEINAIQAKTPEFKINGVEKATNDIQNLITQLEQAKKAGTNISNITANMAPEYTRQGSVTFLQQLNNEQAAMVQSAQQAAQAQQRMEQAIASATGKAQQQSQVLSDLRSMAAQYLSVWGAWSVVKEIAQVTGELELQRKSLETILDSAGKAQELFTQVKTLSQMSPYTFQDMLKSTRQLAAFGVETKNLYGTMKSLSDLGAGLDVDVQRLILAYGHVKSAGVLSGIQRRQFETAGINITGEIAKLYNERFKQAGSMERVTTGDIFNKIKKREIGFEDVEQAITRMTSPGGKFYNMQLKQFETLGGKLRNLRNNYNIMLDEIGKSYHGAFAGFVDTMNNMMESWRTWEKVIKSVVKALIAAKIASIALGKSWTAMNAATNTARKMRYEAQSLGMLMTPHQKSAWSTNFAQSIVNNQDLNKFQKLRAVMRSSVSGDDRWLAVSQITGNIKYADHVKGLNKLGLAFQRLKLGAQSFFTTMRAGFAAIATNPMVWISAAIAGITALTSKASELQELRETATRNAVELSGTDYRDMLKERAKLYEEIGSVTSDPKTKERTWAIDNSKLDAYGAMNAIEKLDEMLQKYDPMYKGHIFDAKMLEDEKDRVLALAEDLSAAMNAKLAWKESASGIFTANTESGYGEDAAWWNLGLKGNWGQWDTAIQEAKEAQQELLKLRGEAIAHQQEIYDILFNDGEVDESLSEGLGDARSYIKEMMEKYNMDFEQALSSYIKTGKNLTIKAPDFELDTSDFQSKINAFGEKAKGMINVMNIKLHDMIANKKNAKDLSAYINEAIKGILSVEGQEVTDPDMFERIGLEIIKGLQPPANASKDIADGYTKATNEALDMVADNMAQAKISEMVQIGMDTGTLSAEMDPKKFAEMMQPQIDAAIKELETQISDPRLSSLISRAFNKVFSRVKINPRPVMNKFDQAWKRVWDRVNDPNDPRFKLKKTFEVIFNAATDEKGFWQDLTKEINTLKEDLTKSIKSFTVLQKVGINLDLVYDTASGKKELQKLAKAMMEIRYTNPELFMKMYNETFVPMQKFLEGISSAEKLGRNVTGDAYSKAEKQREKEAKEAERRKNAADKKKRDAERAENKREREGKQAAREAEEKELERLRNKISLIAQMREEYKRYRKDYSKAEALRLTKEQYKHDYGDTGPLKEADFDNLEDYTQFLEAVIKEIQGSTKISDKNKKDQLVRQAREGQSRLRNTKFQEDSEKMLSQMESDLQDLTKNYDILKTVMQGVGDMKTAGEMSGLGSVFGTTSGFLDNIIEQYLSTKMGMLLQRYGLSLKDYNVDFDKVKGLDEKGIEEYVKDLLGTEQTAELVKGVTSWLKEYKKAYDSTSKSAVDAYTKAAASAMDYESQVKRLSAALKEQNDLIDRSGASEADKVAAKALITSNAYTKALELSNGYQRFNRTDTSMSPSAVEGVTQLLSGAYRMQLKAGSTSVEEFYQKMENLLSKRQSYYTNKTNELLDFSTKGRLERELKKLMGELFDIAEEVEKKRLNVLEAKSKLATAEKRAADLNEQTKKNDDRAAQARRLMQLAKLPSTGPVEEKELIEMAKQIYAEIAANEVGRNELRQANQDVISARIEVDKAEIDLKDSTDKLKNKSKETEKKGNELTKENDRNKETQKAIEVIRKFADALNFVSGVLDSFGLEIPELQDTLDIIGGGLEGAQQGAAFGDMLGGLSGALGNAGPWGAAIGAAIGIAGQLAQVHDKNLQRRIDEIKLDTERMANTLESIRSLRERTLGYDQGALRRQLMSYYSGQVSSALGGAFVDYGDDALNRFMNSGSNAAIAMAGYYSRYSSGNGYSNEFKILQEQREKLMEMYDLEDSKKKKSKEELENYKKQIADLDEQILFFAQDLANELWGIDLKGWADQIGDALMTAFENGTSAASAFKDSVQEIMRDVVKNMLSVGIIQPYMEKLQKKLFGENGRGGLFDPDNPQGTMGATLGGLADFFKEDGPMMVNAAQEFYNGADDLMKQILGYSMKSSDSSANTTTSLTSTASEETMGIVAGYLARLSQDVSVERIMSEMFVNGSWPDYVEQVTNANNSLTAIDRNTTAMMEMMRDGNGALYERVENMSRRLDNFANGIDRVSVR